MQTQALTLTESEKTKIAIFSVTVSLVYKWIIGSNIFVKEMKLCLCRNMDPDAEWNDLMQYDWSGEDGTNTNNSAEPNETLLDADFEEDDEPVILTPSPAPPPTGPPSSSPAASSSPQRSSEKVNVNVNVSADISFDGTELSDTNTYSRFGIKFKTKSGENSQFTEPEKPNMSSEYHQCKAARAASLSFTTVTVDFDENSGKTDTVKFNSLSSLDCIGDKEVLKTFRGTRMYSNNNAVNQNISLSFDPSTLSCMSCKNEHNILSKGEQDGTPVIVFCDQNFVPTLSGDTSCVAVARLENGSLDEIADLAIEILERHFIPPGTIILLGSVSHLASVGTTIFATDWCNTIEKLRLKLRNAKIVPAVPVLREDGPGSIGKQLIELTHWFKTVYEKNTLGCLPVWEKLTEIIGKTDEDGLDLGFTEFYTVALPLSLTPGSALVPVKFKYSSSHTTIRGVDCETSYELLCTLLNHLQKEFASGANSDNILSREPALLVSSAKDFTHCIVAGGSNMKYLCPHLNKLGITVLDLTQKGWVPTQENIIKLAEKIAEVPDNSNIPVILDLLGNIAFRYEQIDGNLALPFKYGGKYHFGGKVLVCPNAVLRNTIRTLKPVFDVIKGDSLFCSPFPRCLYNGCCSEQDHCPGVDTEDYVKSLLHDTLNLRTVCQNMLSEMGMVRMWVPDVVHKMLPACNNNTEIAVGLRHVVAADGVHFTSDGYEKMAAVLKTCIETQREKTTSAAVPSVSDAGGAQVPKLRTKSYYWRGFVSPIGSCRPNKHSLAYRMSHPGGGKWKNPPPRNQQPKASSAVRGGHGDRGGHCDRGRGKFNRPPPPYFRKY
jgi:hypothetical protein